MSLLRSSSLAALVAAVVSTSAYAQPSGLQPLQRFASPAPAMTVIPASDSIDCQMQQGDCEDRCVNDSGGNAQMNACFQRCQEEADRCAGE